MAAGAPSGELRRLEALLDGRLGETLRAMAAQSQERAAYIAALAERPQATFGGGQGAPDPCQMLPIAVPQAPQAAAATKAFDVLKLPAFEMNRRGSTLCATRSGSQMNSHEMSRAFPRAV